jgi:hypothetical protein
MPTQERHILRGLGEIIVALPRFATAPLIRRQHLRWGATDEEVAAQMPGDELVPRSSFTATRAITIDAPPEAVWPWLVQLGYRRAGWYTYDLFDNAGYSSADRILPEYQNLKVGDRVPMAKNVDDTTAFWVVGMEANRWMLWQKPGSTWAWKLVPLGHRTRLITRVKALYGWRSSPGNALLTLVLFEFGDFPMTRKLLLGVKRRAEHLVDAHMQATELSPGTSPGQVATAQPTGIDLYWLPLGAGGHSVRLNGLVFEAIAARLQHRDRSDLYHSALEVYVPEGRFVIEQAPAWGESGERGVVAEGPVGTRMAGRFQLFRYEVRRWREGLIPDVAEAVEGPQRLSDDIERARRLLELVPEVPTPVWGRDELGAGEMWNSNSIISWLIARTGLDVEAIRPPAGGRAPGWRAGVVMAQYHPAETPRRQVRPGSSAT